MRLPRIRLTVQRMMIAVAVMALIFSFGPRRRRFDRVARAYARQEHYTMSSAWALDDDLPSLDHLERMAAFYGRMREKYEHAARYPFLPVPTDPPEPK